METELTSSVAALVQELHKLQLLADPQFDEVNRRLAPRCADARALARELVQRGWLTPYQVNCLLDGRGKSLRFGPYQILERLGEGGCGQVYKARHGRMNRVVAIKFLKPELLTDPEVVQRFLREVQVTSQLTSPYIVHAYDSGQMGNTYYMVVEYVQGLNLDQLVRQRGPLGVAQACSYIMQAAFALDHAHLKGLVHRDIKPSNLVVTQKRSGGDQTMHGAGNKKTLPSFDMGDTAPSIDTTTSPWGIVKLLDLGLARVPRGRDGTSRTLTIAGSGMMGTPDYLAPEQALDFHQADIRADVYGLGCTLFFLLTGQPPFGSGTLAQKLMKHQQAPVPSVRELRPELPKSLDPILQKMLAKQPADRYQSPAEVATILAPLATLEPPASAKKASGFWRKKKPTQKVPLPGNQKKSRRWKLVAGLAAVVLLLAAGLAFVPLPSSSSSHTDSPATAPLAGPVRPGETRRADPRPTTTQPNSIPFLPVVPQAVQLGNPRGRHWAQVLQVVYSPDGKYIATATTGPAIHIWDAANLTEVCVIEPPARQIGAMAFAPDGRRLAAATQGQANAVGIGVSGRDQKSEVRLWDVPSGKEIKDWSHPGNLGLSLAFSPEGETLVLAHQRHAPPAGTVIDFRFWDPSTGKERRPPLEVGGSFGGRVSANAAVGVSASNNGWKIWDLAKGTSDLDGGLGAGRGMSLYALSADGKTMVQATQKPIVIKGKYTNELHVIDLGPVPEDKNRAQTHEVNEEYTVNMLALGPKPTQVLVWGRANDGKTALRLWDVSGAPKKVAQAETSPNIMTVTMSPDGQTVALGTNEGSLRLYDAATLAERYPDNGHRGPVQFLGFTDNDQTLVSGCPTDQSVRAWDQRAGKERGRLAIPTAVGAAPGFFGMNFTFGGSGLAVWNNQGLRWLDPVAGKEHDLKLPDKALNAVYVTQDGRALATVSAGNLRFWDTATGAALPAVVTTGNMTSNLSLSNDGKLVALAGQRIENGKFLNNVRVVDVATGAERYAVPTPFTHLNSLALSGDGRYLGVNYLRQEDKRLHQEWKVWEVATGKEALPPGTVSSALLFAPTGSYLAAWGNLRLQLWDLATGKARFELTLPAQSRRGAGIRSVVFARDGQRLAYTQNDGRVVVLDCATGKPLGEWDFPGVPSSLAVSSDGRQVAVGTPSGLIQVLRVP